MILILELFEFKTRLEIDKYIVIFESQKFLCKVKKTLKIVIHISKIEPS